MNIQSNIPYQTIDPAQLATDLGGKWHQHYGVAPCPVCQPDRRKDQNALTINVKEGKLLLHCKKSHCDFRDILTASGITPGHVEIGPSRLGVSGHVLLLGILEIMNNLEALGQS